LELYLKLDSHKEFARRLADKIQQEMAQDAAASAIAAIHP
jgi:primosomal protein N''